MTSQDRQIRTRTVSLSRARAALIFSLASAAVGLASLLILVLGFSAPFFLLIAPGLATVFSAIRALRWHKAILAATSEHPDQMHWTP